MNLAIRPLDGPTDWPWINSILPLTQVEDTSGLIGFDTDTSERVAACILDNWTYNAVQGHILIQAPSAVKHGFLEACADFIFNYSGRDALYAMVAANNKRALKLDKHLGFTEVFRMPEGFDKGIDYIVMQLLKENCWMLNETKVAQNG